MRLLEEKKIRAIYCVLASFLIIIMTPTQSAKQTPLLIPPKPTLTTTLTTLTTTQEESSLKSSSSLFFALLRKARRERRANLATRHLRRGEFARYFRETTLLVGDDGTTISTTTKTKKMSHIALAAKATEMTRTQKRINRGGY